MTSIECPQAFHTHTYPRTLSHTHIHPHTRRCCIPLATKLRKGIKICHGQLHIVCKTLLQPETWRQIYQQELICNKTKNLHQRQTYRSILWKKLLIFELIENMTLRWYWNCHPFIYPRLEHILYNLKKTAIWSSSLYTI